MKVWVLSWWKVDLGVDPAYRFLWKTIWLLSIEWRAWINETLNEEGQTIRYSYDIFGRFLWPQSHFLILHLIFYYGKIRSKKRARFLPQIFNSKKPFLTIRPFSPFFTTIVNRLVRNGVVRNGGFLLLPSFFTTIENGLLVFEFNPLMLFQNRDHPTYVFSTFN